MDHSDAAAPKEMTSFQMTLCSVLVRKLRQGTAPGARGASSCEPARHEVLRPSSVQQKGNANHTPIFGISVEKSEKR